MKIETKYDINQEVWAITQNKLQKGILKDIKTYTDNSTTYIEYEFYCDGRIFDLPEDDLFKTKAELISHMEKGRSFNSGNILQKIKLVEGNIKRFIRYDNK
ncbi:hypothetical protein [Flavobacterium sp.]|jgi:hypothetical protein|uniref:hypothetical protein n=1 Tax=Flavobacterium sp. TaxID=239 RepID=UPI0037C0C52B